MNNSGLSNCNGVTEASEDSVDVDGSVDSSPNRNTRAGSGPGPGSESASNANTAGTGNIFDFSLASRARSGVSFGSFDESLESPPRPPPTPVCASTPTPVLVPGCSASPQAQFQVVPFYQHQQQEQELPQPVPAPNSGPVSSLAFEEQHLFGFIQDASNLFTTIFYQRDVCLYKLCDLSYKISMQGNQLAFAARIDQLYKFSTACLELEATKIKQHFAALWMHHQAMSAYCATEQVRTESAGPPPDLTVVRRAAYDLLDSIMILQLQIFDSLVKPLGWLEVDVHGLVVTQLTNTAVSMNPYNWQKQQQHSHAVAASKSASTSMETQAIYVNGYANAAAGGASPGFGGGRSLTLASIPAPSNPYGLVYGESLSMLGPGPSPPSWGLSGGVGYEYVNGYGGAGGGGGDFGSSRVG